jgi:hypothetical protein
MPLNRYTNYIHNYSNSFRMHRLTAPHSGSDAASMSEAYGEVVERDGKLGIHVALY